MNSLDETLGVCLIGAIVSSAMFGIICVQSQQYYVRYKPDRRWTKILVGALWCLETIHTVLVTISIYYYAVSNFGNDAALSQITWSFQLSLFIGALLTASVEIFYAFRLYLLSDGKMWLPAVIIALAVVHVAFATAFTLHGLLSPDFISTTSSNNNIVAVLTFVVNIVCEIVIAASMCILLHRNRTGYGPTTMLISTLTRNTVYTGILTVLFSSCCLVTFLLIPSTVTFSIFYFIGCRISVSALLYMLNSRESISEKWKAAQEADQPNMTYMSGISQAVSSHPPSIGLRRFSSFILGFEGRQLRDFTVV